MIDFIIFILATIGATMITTQSYLFMKFRDKMLKLNANLGKLFKCSQCSGFYWGLIIKILLLIYYHQVLSLIIILLYGFIGSIVCYVTYLLIKPLMDKYD
jgi:hypothetical protein